MLVLTTGCGPAVPENDRRSLRSATAVEGTSGAGPEIRFTDVTAQAGLQLRTRTFAVAAGDVDGNGFPDLVVSLHGLVALFLNQGDGTFRRDDASIGFRRGDSHGLSLWDADADGRPDLFVTLGVERGRGGGANRLYLNRGERFDLWSDLDPVLTDPAGAGRSTCPMDLDGDGRVDLLLSNLVRPERPHRLALASGVGDLRFREGNLGSMGTAGGTGVTAFDLDGSGQLHYVLTRGGSDAGSIFRIEDGQWQEVGRRRGVEPAPNVMDVVPFDFDLDGDLDLFVARGLRLPEGAVSSPEGVHFLVNVEPRKIKGFKLSIASGPIEVEVWTEGRVRPDSLRLGKGRTVAAAMPLTLDALDPVLLGDPHADPESDEGVFLWRDESGALVLSTLGQPDGVQEFTGRIRGVESPARLLSEFGTRQHPHLENRLYRNEGERFVEVAREAGVEGEGLSSDAVVADFDNDSDLDLYVVNGGLGFGNPPNRLYVNQGGGRFVEMSAVAGVQGPTTGRGNAAVALDFDRDGDQDLFLLNGSGPSPGDDGPLTLLRNDTVRPGGSVVVDLKGTSPNTLGMGTRLRAAVGGGTLPLVRACGDGHLSTSILPFHVGLGRESLAQLEVTWPSGRGVELAAPAGSRLVLTEPDRRTDPTAPTS